MHGHPIQLGFVQFLAAHLYTKQRVSFRTTTHGQHHARHLDTRVRFTLDRAAEQLVQGRAIELDHRHVVVERQELVEIAACQVSFTQVGAHTTAVHDAHIGACVLAQRVRHQIAGCTGSQRVLAAAEMRRNSAYGHGHALITLCHELGDRRLYFGNGMRGHSIQVLQRRTHARDTTRVAIPLHLHASQGGKLRARLHDQDLAFAHALLEEGVAVTADNERQVRMRLR